MTRQGAFNFELMPILALLSVFELKQFTNQYLLSKKPSLLNLKVIAQTSELHFIFNLPYSFHFEKYTIYT